MASLVQVETLTKEYGRVRALDGVTFDVESGEWIAMMGPSGSGKTTLINILGGLDTPTSGRAVVDGVDVARFDEAGLTRYRAEKVGFIFQQFHLVPYLTAVENVMLAQYFHSMTDEGDAKRALERVGLGNRLTHLPAQLSGGEQQRVAVARALINHPKLLLADEPTGNLDEINERIVIDLLRELHSEGHTIVMVTHDPSIGSLADRRIELAHGRLQQITSYTAEDEERFDHILEQVWICGEEGVPARLERVRSFGVMDPVRMVTRLGDRGMLMVDASEVKLTPRGENRARDVVRRHRRAERLFTDTFAIVEAEADTHACKFEHIISSELEQKICTFLGHPEKCPHGNPIPAGVCCPKR
jgi:putative ABC transport system ATP-binding protein